MNNADNVIAWAEGQGEDPQRSDFIIFLGGSRGVNQKLIVAPGINDYTDLKGKIFAVDAPTTGYAIVGVYILKKHGLELNKDYTFKAFGNTAKRADAMSRGDASTDMMTRRRRNSKARIQSPRQSRRSRPTLRQGPRRNAARLGQQKRRSAGPFHSRHDPLH